MDSTAKTRSWIIAAAVVFIAATVVFIAVGAIKSRTPTTPASRLGEKPLARDDVAGVQSPQAPSVSPASVPKSENARVEKWRALAKGTRLIFLKHDSDRIHLNEAASAIMGLSETEAEKVNTSLAQFIERMRSEELFRAYVSIKPDGSREIVVPDFDRAELIGQLRSDISATTTRDVAEFILENIKFDSKLAISGTEIRASVVKSDDGTDREVFVRTVAIREQEGGPAVKGPNHITTTRPLVNGFSFRNRHLFEAMDTLPIRKESETAKADSNPAQLRNR